MQNEEQIIQRINFLWSEIEKDKNILNNVIAIRELFRTLGRKRLIEMIEPEKPTKAMIKKELKKIVQDEVKQFRG